MTKEIRYLGHAVQKLKERKVTRVQVSEILANPDQVLPARLGRKRAIKLLEGRVIHVIYEEYVDHLLVVTVYPK